MASFEEVTMSIVTEFFTGQIEACKEEGWELCSLFYGVETRLENFHEIRVEQIAHQIGKQVSLPDGYTFSRMMTPNVPLFLDENAK